MNRLTATVGAACAIMLSGCFTGIESTPRISAADVRAANALPTPEEEFGRKITGQPPRLWRSGKQWQVDDSKIAIIFTPPATETLAGQRLTLDSIDSVTTVTGTQAVRLHLSATSGSTYTYIPGVETRDFDALSALEIPFAVELSPVCRADSLMRGNTYFIKTPLWRDLTGQGVTGRRHVAVTVTAVNPGTATHPLRVVFHAEGDTTLRFVPLTYGTSASSSRNFDRYFSFTNPREAFPRITDATWHLITASRVTEGMTRDECRLALGIPASISRGATTQAEVEHWSYDNGRYLIFEDGILVRFR